MVFWYFHSFKRMCLPHIFLQKATGGCILLKKVKEEGSGYGEEGCWWQEGVTVVHQGGPGGEGGLWEGST